MKALKRIFTLILFASILHTTSFAQEVSTYFSHIVQRGESLYGISIMYGVSQDEIIRLNPGCQDKLYAGESIRIPQTKEGRNVVFHTIQPGETLYRLTVKYNTSAKMICTANPGLSAETFRIGKVIRVPLNAPAETAAQSTTGKEGDSQSSVKQAVKPKCNEMHKVKRRETIFSISRLYKISEKELIAANPELKTQELKKGQWLCIPAATKKERPTVTPRPERQPTDKELFESVGNDKQHLQQIRAAVMLPFTHDKRMVEYYEGILIAVDSLKRTGTSVELFVYDTDSPGRTIDNLLSNSEMESMHLIIGPSKGNEIEKVAKFASKHKIRLVIPFSSKEEEVFYNPYVYLVNTPQSYIYSEVYDHFFRQFKNMNIVFLESKEKNDKKDFISGLKNELSNRHIAYKSLYDTSSYTELDAVTDTTINNIFIPTTGNSISLTRVVPQLAQLTRLHPTAEIHMFGYPEWQTYTIDYLDSFFGLDTYFYSSFYTNNLLPAAKNFISQYRKWYSKEMAMSYPRYGMLGFDTAYFFLKGLSIYGTDLENNLDKMSLKPIQTGFKFERVNNWGGFINKKVFFVNFSKNYELIKMDFE